MPTPTGNEDLTGALTQAQSFAWDESIGYNMYGTRQFNPNCDCSSFVSNSLYLNGFNVQQFGNTYAIIQQLQSYQGFTEYIYTNGFVWQHGDIAVYDDRFDDPSTTSTKGHTFFYAEDVYGYTDSNWRIASAARKSTLARARIEASDTHGHPENGDQDNGHGAHTEVWIHNFYFDPGEHVWHIFRWQTAPGPIPPPTPPGPGPGPGPGPVFPSNKFPIWLLNKKFIKGLPIG